VSESGVKAPARLTTALAHKFSAAGVHTIKTAMLKIWEHAHLHGFNMPLHFSAELHPNASTSSTRSIEA
jgi:hypothetical protein